MNLRIKRVLYALVLGALFAYFSSITEAATSSVNLDGQLECSQCVDNEVARK